MSMLYKFNDRYLSINFKSQMSSYSALSFQPWSILTLKDFHGEYKRFLDRLKREGLKSVAPYEFIKGEHYDEDGIQSL